MTRRRGAPRSYGEDGGIAHPRAYRMHSLAVVAVLTPLRHGGEEGAQPLHPVEHHIGGEGVWVDAARFELLPAQRGGNARVRSGSAAAVGRGSVAPDALLLI